MKELPEKMTIGEGYGPAMKLTTQEEADDYFEALVQHSMKYFGKTREEATEIQRSNLGYYAGYYDHETRRRVERLFHCCHPVFGSIECNGPPTPEEALEAGLRMAAKEK